jgi:hypothetical protein
MVSKPAIQRILHFFTFSHAQFPPGTLSPLHEMEHKYSRVNYQASKNYYQLMQMAYLINQLMVISIHFQADYLKGKNHQTLKKRKWPALFRQKPLNIQLISMVNSVPLVLMIVLS